MRKGRKTLLLVMSSLLLAVTAETTAIASTFTAVETRITTAPTRQYDPAISNPIICYTGDNGEMMTEIFYFDLARGVQVQVTNEPGRQELPAVSGPLIGYCDLWSRDVLVFDTVTGMTLNLTSQSTAMATNPAVDGNLVAWEDRRSGVPKIYATDISTSEFRQISTGSSSDTIPAADSGKVVWQAFHSPYECDIAMYDWATSTTTSITVTPDRDERAPDISGSTIVYEMTSSGERDICAYDLDTGAEQRLSLPGIQTNANVSGDIVAFEDLASGISHVRLWNLTTNDVYTVTSSTSVQNLNDLDGNKVVYTDNRNGQLDIYMTEFSFSGSDTTAPVVVAPADLRLQATAPEGVSNEFAAIASDDVAVTSLKYYVAGLEVTSPYVFPVGTTTVTCEAKDAAGNQGTDSFTVTVLSPYSPSGVLQPFNADGSSIFKAGSTAPISVTLDGYTGGAVTGALIHVYVVKIDSDVEGSVYEAVSTAAADDGNVMRELGAGSYKFNLSTRSYDPGTYRLKVVYPDGTYSKVDFSIK